MGCVQVDCVQVVCGQVGDGQWTVRRAADGLNPYLRPACFAGGFRAQVGWLVWGGGTEGCGWFWGFRASTPVWIPHNSDGIMIYLAWNQI